jgi:uncharacterized protein YjbI with pentapeptide repeats
MSFCFCLFRPMSCVNCGMKNVNFLHANFHRVNFQHVNFLRVNCGCRMNCACSFHHGRHRNLVQSSPDFKPSKFFIGT